MSRSVRRKEPFAPVNSAGRGTGRFVPGAVSFVVVAAAAFGVEGGAGEKVGEVRSGGLADRRMEFGGRERTYHLFAPGSVSGKRPLPLVLVLHGGGGTGERMGALDKGGLQRLAEGEGFLICYPDGVDKHWNDGRRGLAYRAHREQVDDVGFLCALIDVLTEEFGVDPGRVYAVGISNGAMMAQRLAVERSEKVAAIACLAGSIPEALIEAGERPSRPVSVLLMNGTADPLVPFGGGEVRFFRKRLGRVLSVPEVVRRWVEWDGCRPEAERSVLPDTDPGDGTRVLVERYSGGKDGSEVVLYRIEGGGHTWPGGRQYFPRFVVGRTSRDIEASRVIWDFFRRHSRRSRL